MFAPTRDFLEACCRDAGAVDPLRAAELVRTMGPLGRLWPRPEVVAAADRFVGAAAPLREPLESGGFRVLLLTPGRGHYATLRRAFALPLRWVAGDADSPHLPPGLARYAAGLIAGNQGELSLPPPHRGRWTLHLGAGLEGRCDFSRFDFDCGWASATASLLGGLQLAGLDAAPDEEVMASVDVTERGLGGVHGVADKLDAARDAGARLVFLAAADRDEATKWHRANPGSPVRTMLLEPRTTLREALSPFLQAIEARPGVDAPLGILQQFYEKRLLTPALAEQRRAFYLDVVVDRLAAEYRGPLPLTGPCRNLIGVVGPGAAPPLALLARVLAPGRVLLLHDTEAAPHAAALGAHLAGVRGIGVSTHEFKTLFGPLEELRPEVDRAIRKFLDADPTTPGDRDTVIDLTAGARRIPFILLDVAPARAACVHVDAERVSGPVEKIGTEKIVTIAPRRAGP